MKKKILKKARRLAARPYEVQFVPDFNTDGNPVFFARIPEMPGCVAHGDTIEEAREWIELAKVDFIYFYLEDGISAAGARRSRRRGYSASFSSGAKRGVDSVRDDQFQQ